MPRPEPKDMIEFNARYFENYKMSGMGLDTEIHLPCLFCAAKDFIVHKILEAMPKLSEGAVCQKCGRGAKAILKALSDDGPGGGYTVEFVQTEGPDQPDWLDPKMRRL